MQTKTNQRYATDYSQGQKKKPRTGEKQSDDTTTHGGGVSRETGPRINGNRF